MIGCAFHAIISLCYGLYTVNEQRLFRIWQDRRLLLLSGATYNLFLLK